MLKDMHLIQHLEVGKVTVVDHVDGLPAEALQLAEKLVICSLLFEQQFYTFIQLMYRFNNACCEEKV